MSSGAWRGVALTLAWARAGRRSFIRGLAAGKSGEAGAGAAALLCAAGRCPAERATAVLFAFRGRRGQVQRVRPRTALPSHEHDCCALARGADWGCASVWRAGGPEAGKGTRGCADGSEPACVRCPRPRTARRRAPSPLARPARPHPAAGPVQVGVAVAVDATQGPRSRALGSVRGAGVFVCFLSRAVPAAFPRSRRAAAPSVLRLSPLSPPPHSPPHHVPNTGERAGEEVRWFVLGLRRPGIARPDGFYDGRCAFCRLARCDTHPRPPCRASDRAAHPALQASLRDTGLWIARSRGARTRPAGRGRRVREADCDAALVLLFAAPLLSHPLPSIPTHTPTHTTTTTAGPAAAPAARRRGRGRGRRPGRPGRLCRRRAGRRRRRRRRRRGRGRGRNHH
jgi:hypothetical protein